ncbi:MAG TPA: hypothetical protein VFQ53_20815 [Kofleriaceae bacterium]|nr:hypothetical protein [Kofleriaceae bacterium]
MKRIALLALVLAAGCGDNLRPEGGNGGGSDGGGSNDGPGGNAFTTLASFDPAMGQLPEGITVSGGNVYVGLAPLGQVVKVDGGTFTAFGNLPGTVKDTYTLGLAPNAAGDIFVGVGVAGAAPVPAPGIYKIPAAGGQATLFASAAAMVFPNGLDVDGSILYVADSGSGKIFRVGSGGGVSLWKGDPLLVGDQTACGGSGAGFNIGANGITHDASFRYVAVSDFGRIVKIAINADGTAGAATVVAEDCALLQGADGIALDSDGSILVVRNGPSNTMQRVAQDGTINNVHTGAPLDGPASIVVDGTRALITNSAFFSAPAGNGTPSVVSFDLQ